jgi:hypothetical protein
MRKFWIVSGASIILLLQLVCLEITSYAQPSTLIRGKVFHDRNGNGAFDAGRDEPLKGVAVSNGRDVSVTNRDGSYQLPYRDDAAIFVVKPSHWMVPVNEKQMPQFFYMHSSSGISGSEFEGLPPTGPLPQSVDFALLPKKEPDKFDVLVFGDTQPRDDKEIYYMSRDVLPELTGAGAEFGVTLGDVVFDNLNLFDHITSAISTVGIPWWYVAGNHDFDFTGNNSIEARGAWNRTFGPSWYSFSYGPAHFVVLDNVRWITEGEKRYYRTGLGEDQMQFLQNEIQRLDNDQLLVLLAHIPHEGSTEWYDEAEKQAFYQLLASHANSVSLVAHTHRHYHQFISEEQGFPGTVPHHMISVGTVCGAWWTGAPDEFGIPHAMMSDGTPNSYAFLHIDGNQWKLGLKAAGKPEDYQMHIYAPDSVGTGDAKEIKVAANIYNALPSAEVKMRIGNENDWVTMNRVLQADPVRLEVVKAENSLGDVPWRKMSNPSESEHIWEASREVNLAPGVYVIEVKATDDWWEYEGRRLLHVK